MMRKRILGFVTAIACGVGIYVTGYAFGEIRGHNTVTQMYSQGYRTGFIKGFRRFKKDLNKTDSPQLNLPSRTRDLAIDARAK